MCQCHCTLSVYKVWYLCHCQCALYLRPGIFSSASGPYLCIRCGIYARAIVVIFVWSIVNMTLSVCPICVWGVGHVPMPVWYPCIRCGICASASLSDLCMICGLCASASMPQLCLICGICASASVPYLCMRCGMCASASVLYLCMGRICISASVQTPQTPWS